MSRGIQICFLFGVLVATLALTALSEARIVPEERRIGKVELDMTERAVRETLGAPDRIKQVRPHVRQFVYRKRKLRVGIYTKHVYEISTESPAQKTRAGSGVGSTRGALERAEDDRLHCQDDRVEGDCWIQPRGRYSATYTYFLIENKQVVEVVVRRAPTPL